MAERGTHLVERLAAQLRGDAGLARTDPAMPQPAPAGAAGGPHAAAVAVAPAPPPGIAAAALSAASMPPSGDMALAEAAVAEPVLRDDVILELAALQRAGLALAGPRSRISEECRVTAARILSSLRGTPRRGDPDVPHGLASLAMVTSARHGEGRSFCALNIAASITQNGSAEVILVDLDDGTRSLTALLGLGKRPGLLELAADPALQPEAVVLRTALGGCAVLPLGVDRSATARGGVTPAVLAALDRVRRRFPRRIVLLDSGPCLSSGDPGTLAAAADQVILVVEAGRTRRRTLEAAFARLRACANVVLVLNKVRLSHRHSLGSFYYSGDPS